MSEPSYTDKYIRSILADVTSVAIVGASPKNVRPSYFVVKYLVSKGYGVYPINPGHAGKEICGRKVYASLSDIEVPIDMVDIFRGSEAALGITKEALSLKPLPKVMWMQLTVINHEAEALAEAAGVKVVMNRCPKIEYARLSHEIGWVGVNSKVISAKKPTLREGYQRFGLAKT
ncbi:MAG: CoA-binding protein [Pseudomonadota bacterium]